MFRLIASQYLLQAQGVWCQVGLCANNALMFFGFSLFSYHFFLSLYPPLNLSITLHAVFLSLHPHLSLPPSISTPIWLIPAFSPLHTISFSLPPRRVMGMRTCDSRCLFSGSKGEVCCVEPLHAGPELKDHPITQYSLLAMASLTKVRSGLPPPHNYQQTFLFLQLRGLQYCCVLRKIQYTWIPMSSLALTTLNNLLDINKPIMMSVHAKSLGRLDGFSKWGV